VEHILFLTGRLAEPGLRRVLSQLGAAPFTWDVQVLGVQVAALLTSDMIGRRLPAFFSEGDAVQSKRPDRVIVPGRVRGDLVALSNQLGLPVVRGPDELKDLPQFFKQAAKPTDLSQYTVQIFAEIVDAPQLTVAATVQRAKILVAQGANVIDLGCLPQTPYPHLEDSVRALKAEGWRVSVDSMDTQELLRGGHAGADYLLSLSLDTLWVADQVPATPVLIGRTPADEDSLYAAIELMKKKGRRFLADPILDPIPFGFTASIVRYHRLRQRYADAAIMMGIGNLTELTEADTSGINALLIGMAAELRVAAVLTTAVSAHARRAVAEADVARRVMHAAVQQSSLPKGFSNALMTVHAKHPHPDTPEEIQAVAAQVRDPNFRVQVSAQGVHVYNRDGHRLAQDAFSLWPQLGLDNDASHAFYMGVELARAQTAWRLGKRYVQDQDLDWGCATEQSAEDLLTQCAPGTTREPGHRSAAEPKNDTT
jgi:dihydropteroate synthase